MRKILGIVVIALVIVIGAGVTFGYSWYVGPTEFTTVTMMDTTVNLTVTGRKAKAASAAAVEEMRRLERILSTQITGSDVDNINKAAGVSPVKVAPETLEVVKMGLEYGAKSGGVFDITINPLLKLWGFGTGNPHLPDAKDIEEAKKLVNYRDVIVDDQNSTVLLRRTGMSIDLGGVAKGFIVAEATNVLKSYGINHAIVDAGGDLYILGFKPKKYPWGKNEPYRVGLQDPNANTGTGILGVVSMPPGAVVTSGDYERYFEVNGVRYHHIIDPRTGYPAKGLTSVTIKTSDPAMADLVATAAMVLGPEEGKKLVNEWPGIDAILITSGTMTQYVSPGMQAIYTPLSSEQ